MELSDKLPLILDGATGTQMQKQGYSCGDCLERWILERPEHILNLQRGYIEAGSDIIYAPTFGANRIALGKHGLSDRVREYNLRLVELSQKAACGKALIGGDIAPAGIPMEPYGDLEAEELFEVHAEQARALEEAGVDLFAIETQISGEEAGITVEAIQSVSDKPIFLSFTCTPNGRTFYGESFPELLTAMQSKGVAGFGINCFADFEILKSIVSEMKQRAKIPLIVKPNAGMPKNVNGRLEYMLSPEDFAEHMSEIRNLGASLLGGCCGTDIRHISTLSATIRMGIKGKCSKIYKK